MQLAKLHGRKGFTIEWYYFICSKIILQHYQLICQANVFSICIAISQRLMQIQDFVLQFCVVENGQFSTVSSNSQSQMDTYICGTKQLYHKIIYLYGLYKLCMQVLKQQHQQLQQSKLFLPLQNPFLPISTTDVRIISYIVKK